MEVLITSLEFLRLYFPILTGFAPYRWQEEAFVQLVEGKLPGTIPAPTGSGKTSLIAIWVIAFAWSRIHSTSAPIPRRLVWVVNNRVVVDQATDTAERIRQAIGDLPQSDPLRRVLADSAVESGGPLLAISTLRGQFADNEEWRRDPSRPAIIIGTVDLIGSNLLFRGYREGRYWRPTNAGLLGVDALIVNDEAHLTPAFRRLLVEIESWQPAKQVPGTKRFQVHLLSATSDPDPRGIFQHDYQEDVRVSEHFREVFHARKRMRLETVEDKNYEAAALAIATVDPPPRTIIFVERPEKALEFARRLEKLVGPERVQLLTGTMRGYERDQLAIDPVFSKFRAKETPSDGPSFLVCTAAGEVGVDITCERMITGLVAAERLQQRFGRLNRFGSAGEAEAVVLAPGPKANVLRETLAWLGSLPDGDISPAALLTRPAPEAARTPPPLMARLEPWRVQTWAQTTQRDSVQLSARKRVPPMAPVAPWLHGKTDDPPDTEVAWRDDVTCLAQAEPSQIEEVLGKYRVLARERLKEPTSRVVEKLQRIQLGRGLDATASLLVVARDGTVEVVRVDELQQQIETDPDGAIQRLAYKLLILPTGAGKPDRGMFTQESPGEDVAHIDVADIDPERPRARFLVGENHVRPLGGSALPDPALPDDINEYARYAADRGYGKPLIVFLPGDDEEEPSRYVLYLPAAPARQRPPVEIELEPHLGRVAELAAELAQRLDLGSIAEELREAGQRHDLGKDCPVWRKAMRVKPGGPALAKTKGLGSPRLLGGYRHEFRSLVGSDPGHEIGAHACATHHGNGRPFFETRQYDPAIPRHTCAQVAYEQARRFGRLQQRFGPWGLAYIEAVFKAADGIASAEGEKQG
jgi:CRISPR-associated endonuclease/helicase Cas3